MNKARITWATFAPSNSFALGDETRLAIFEKKSFQGRARDGRKGSKQAGEKDDSLISLAGQCVRLPEIKWYAEHRTGRRPDLAVELGILQSRSSDRVAFIKARIRPRSCTGRNPGAWQVYKVVDRVRMEDIARGVTKHWLLIERSRNACRKLCPRYIVERLMNSFTLI